MPVVNLLPHKCTISRLVRSNPNVYGQRRVVPDDEAVMLDIPCRLQDGAATEYRTASHTDTVVSDYTLFLGPNTAIRETDEITNITDRRGHPVGASNPSGAPTRYTVTSLDTRRGGAMALFQVALLKRIGV